MMNTTRIIGAAMLLCAGCAPQSNTQITSSAPAPEQGVAVKQVTLYLKGMNERLQIL